MELALAIISIIVGLVSIVLKNALHPCDGERFSKIRDNPGSDITVF